MELKDVSIAKYLKPEVQAEAQAVEEKLRNLNDIREKKEKEYQKEQYLKHKAQSETQTEAEEEELRKRKYLTPYKEEEKEVYDKLVDMIIQNVVIRDSTIKFLLKSLLNEEVYTIVDTSIQKINQLTEITDELINIENQIEEYPADLTKEEGDKLSFLADYVAYSNEIFYDARAKIEKQLDEFIGNLLDIIIYIKDTRTNTLDSMEKRDLIKDIIKKISKNIINKKLNIT